MSPQNAFFMVPKRLGKRIGLINACILGLVRSYCTMTPEGICYLGQQQMADDLGLKRWRVNQGLRWLVVMNYLDCTRQGRDYPNIYRMTELSAGMYEKGDI